MNILKLIGGFFKSSNQNSRKKIYISDQDFSEFSSNSSKNGEEANSSESTFKESNFTNEKTQRSTPFRSNKTLTTTFEPEFFQIKSEEFQTTFSAEEIIDIVASENFGQLQEVISSSDRIFEDETFSASTATIMLSKTDLDLAKNLLAKIEFITSEQAYQLLHGIINNTEHNTVDHNSVELLRYAVHDLGIDAGAMHYEYDDLSGKVFTKDVLQTIMENNLILLNHPEHQQNLIEFAKIIVSSQKVCGLEDKKTVEELMTALENRNANDPRLNFEFRIQKDAAITPKENFIEGPISANQVNQENSVNRNIR